ncbi:Predicted arabinose efflux permease, MFS family [Xaviernesmea oryzae]|uniref:Predicted arabinose efflux permease, MFS family n=1 Tax=Xaviernesmea oryzae TaxID=464029 RepID=A0A1X7FAT3_9HYPH|nr:MFS transporter [Xaviernesmea oryzae]SMF49285.1 Predicted arabinose efflux permease, MFS family [Xaviernesmea oryzae]
MTSLLSASPSPAAFRMTVYSFIFAVLISATSSAPTPLYHLYQELFHLSPAMITFIFGSYAFALLAALLTLGGLSDYIGRRPLILVALLFNAAALVIFLLADSGGMLLAGRIVQGIAAGIAFPTFGAAILDTDKRNGPILNSITAFLGLTIGTLAGGTLVAFAPEPTHLIYAILFVATIFGIIALAFMPETTAGRPGALGAMRPRISVPQRAWGPLIKVTPVNVAGWALAGFYLSLMPTLVAVATGIASPFVGGAVVATSMLSATISVFVSRTLAPRRVLFAATSGLITGVLITLVGVEEQAVGLLFLGTAVAGLGLGSIFANILKIVMPLAESHERAGLFAAFLVESYLAFAVPAIVAGLAAPALGLSMTAYIYGAVIILLAAISIAATRTSLVENPAV